MSDPSSSPRIEALGLYSFSADSVAYERFITLYLDNLDPANWDEKTRATLGALRPSILDPMTEETRRLKREEIVEYSREAALVEVMVTNPDATFDVGDFTQPDPRNPAAGWQVAWNEKYLSLDGEQLLEDNRKQPLLGMPPYRIAFVIHYWLADQPLLSSYGEVRLPPMEPLPDRLWRLAPYEQP